MISAGHEDRLRRLRVRGEVLFENMTRTPEKHREMMERAWQEALKTTGGAHEERAQHVSSAAVQAARLDAILCLLERITRPSSWLDKQATWFGWAQMCLIDAVSRVGAGAPVPPPILAVEPIESPLYVPRARAPGAWLSQATPADLPLPVVLCPGNLLEEPWAWATLFHEVGHHLDAALGDTPALREVLRAEEKKRCDDDLYSWSGEKWPGEVIADLYAGLLGGPGAVETLKASLSDKQCSPSHPSDADRIAVLEAAFAGVRDGLRPSGDRAVEIVARALVDRFAGWKERVQEDCAAPEDPRGSVRLVPGMLHRRHAAGMGPEVSREACHEAFESPEIRHPKWVLTKAHLATLAGAMRNLVETRVQPGEDALKVPPIELLIRHDRVTFVGATHGQLVEKLREARKSRRRPYQHIEVFALADEPLRELILDGKTGDALIEERDESLRALREHLTREDVPHHIYLYTQPYVFASFWDVEDNKARPEGAPPAHIHVSNALWGMDLRRAVGQDLEAPAGQRLPPAMASRVEALRHLRETSREVT